MQTKSMNIRIVIVRLHLKSKYIQNVKILVVYMIFVFTYGDLPFLMAWSAVVVCAFGASTDDIGTIIVALLVFRS